MLMLMVLCAELPYVFILMQLKDRAPSRRIMALATNMAAGWLTVLATASIFGHVFLAQAELGWLLGAYWLTFGSLQVAALIGAQGADRKLARAIQGTSKLHWRVALPLICFGVFLWIALERAMAD